MLSFLFKTVRQYAGDPWRVNMRNGASAIRMTGALLAGMALLGVVIVCHSIAKVADKLHRG